MTARALEVLNLEAVCPDRTITADGPQVEIRSAGTTVARVLAVPFDLAADPSAADYAAGSDDVPTVLAYPGLLSGRERLSPALRAAAHRTGPPRPGSTLTGTVPVNPLEIDSTERLARALRWPLSATFVTDHYPQRITFPTWWRPQPRAWAELETKQLRLLRPPSGPETSALTAEIQQVDAARPRRRGEQRQPDAEAIVGELNQAAALLNRIATCPVCRSDRAIRFEPRSNDTFHCRCEECNGQWGLRCCNTCDRRFPVLWAHGASVCRIEHEDTLDAAFGSEIAALPCPASPDWSQFHCPWCLACSDLPVCRN